MEYTLKELEEWNVKIEKKAKEFGLDYYPQEFEIIGFNMLECHQNILIGVMVNHMKKIKHYIH